MAARHVTSHVTADTTRDPPEVLSSRPTRDWLAHHGIARWRGRDHDRYQPGTDHATCRFLSDRDDRVALSGRTNLASPLERNREWRAERWNQERRALSLRGRVSLRSTRKRGQRTTQANHTQTRKT